MQHHAASLGGPKNGDAEIPRPTATPKARESGNECAEIPKTLTSLGQCGTIFIGNGYND